MEWTRAVDAYCERLDPSFWAEPVNALTNLAFVLAAFVMWRRCATVRTGRALSVVLAAIGLGSFLFHSFAQVWAGLADAVPIGLFVLLYLFAVNRDALGLSRRAALGLTALFIPYAAVMVPLFAQLPALGVGAAYAPVPFLILIYAWILRDRAPECARGMMLGAFALTLSIGFRTLDAPLCGVWPHGTHFLWHLLNAATLGWMIEVYRRLRLGKPARAR